MLNTNKNTAAMEVNFDALKDLMGGTPPPQSVSGFGSGSRSGSLLSEISVRTAPVGGFGMPSAMSLTTPGLGRSAVGNETTSAGMTERSALTTEEERAERDIIVREHLLRVGSTATKPPVPPLNLAAANNNTMGAARGPVGGAAGAPESVKRVMNNAPSHVSGVSDTRSSLLPSPASTPGGQSANAPAMIAALMKAVDDAGEQNKVLKEQLQECKVENEALKEQVRQCMIEIERQRERNSILLVQQDANQKMIHTLQGQVTGLEQSLEQEAPQENTVLFPGDSASNAGTPYFTSEHVMFGGDTRGLDTQGASVAGSREQVIDAAACIARLQQQLDTFSVQSDQRIEHVTRQLDGYLFTAIDHHAQALAMEEIQKIDKLVHNATMRHAVTRMAVNMQAANSGHRSHPQYSQGALGAPDGAFQPPFVGTQPNLVSVSGTREVFARPPLVTRKNL